MNPLKVNRLFKMIPKEMYSIMTSNEDISDSNNFRKTQQFQRLFKSRPDCKKLAQNSKFWVAKLREDYGIEYKNLEASDAFTEYVNFSRVVDSDYSWYFVYDSTFDVIDPRHDLSHRRMIVLNKLIELYTKLKSDNVKLLPVRDVKVTIGKDMYTIEISPQSRQIIPCGKIIKSLNEAKMGAWYMLFSSTEFKCLYDKCLRCNVTLINSGTSHNNCVVFECKPYYVCAFASGPMLLHSDELNIDNVVQIPDNKIDF